MVRDDACAAAIPGADWDLTLDEWKAALAALQDYSSKTWAEIFAMPAPGSPRNHQQDAESLNSAARALYERTAETPFRIRLGGTRRLWGHRAGGVFYPLFYDRDHKASPTAKRHT
ncbi:MAG: hypothetical protein LBL01_01910 [Bifidobacteriaceae bacterium]|jgi:hypothetical protein|nr:hypothetical protein [Bifidobacteriaceae bacterium]